MVAAFEKTPSKQLTMVAALEDVVIRQLPLSVVWKVSSKQLTMVAAL